MKTPNTHTATSLYTLILIGTLATVLTAIACSNKPEPLVVRASQPIGPTIRPDAPRSVAFTASPEPPNANDNSSFPAKVPPPKFITYKSRDYGVSFVYPWQYTHLNAKAVAHDSSLQPQSDGHSGQLTLARVDIPKGFYPDTDFDSGYFALSLNPDLSEQECLSSLNVSKDAKPQTASFNGTDFRWIETDSGGRGSSAKLRNYVAFTNGTCYELETGVKTSNDGLAREVDPDQVLRRLDSILTTVKVASSTPSPTSGAGK